MAALDCSFVITAPRWGERVCAQELYNNIALCLYDKTTLDMENIASCILITYKIYKYVLHYGPLQLWRHIMLYLAQSNFSVTKTLYYGSLRLYRYVIQCWPVYILDRVNTVFRGGAVVCATGEYKQSIYYISDQYISQYSYYIFMIMAIN